MKVLLFEHGKQVNDGEVDRRPMPHVVIWRDKIYVLEKFYLGEAYYHLASSETLPWYPERTPEQQAKYEQQ